MSSGCGPPPRDGGRGARRPRGGRFLHLAALASLTEVAIEAAKDEVEQSFRGSFLEELRSFFDDTVAPIVAYDDQYATDLVGTLEAYRGQNCNMNSTAAAIYAHRHTVGYRLERVKELTGLDRRSPRIASGSGSG